ncbi:hypothetical protein HZ326_14953 [Fusarium oxysporum f. sp. albedinis]|nr:hypothetical protein HZ326_14953 [Fusarium oxysporum f. sp. albedinis]
MIETESGCTKCLLLSSLASSFSFVPQPAFQVNYIPVSSPIRTPVFSYRNQTPSKSTIHGKGRELNSRREEAVKPWREPLARVSEISARSLMAQHLSVQQKLASQRSLHLMVMLSFSLQLERSVKKKILFQFSKLGYSEVSPDMV